MQELLSARRFWRAAGVFVALASFATLINWIVTTGGAGFSEPPSDPSVARQRSLWDWMDLLLIPLVLGFGAFLFNLALQRRQTELAAEESARSKEGAGLPSGGGAR